MGIMAAFAIPALVNIIPRRQLESSAWRLVSDLRMARHAAVSAGEYTRVEFRESNNDYRVWLPEGMERVSLPEGICFSGNNFPYNSSGLRMVAFSPQGAPNRGGTVIFTNNRGDKLYVITTPATGRVRVSREPPEHW